MTKAFTKFAIQLNDNKLHMAFSKSTKMGDRYMKKFYSNVSLKSLINTLPLCKNSCERYFAYLLGLSIIPLTFHEYYHHKFVFQHWDLLLFTGVGTLIIGLRLASGLRKRFELTISRLLNREVFKIARKDKNEFFDQIEKQAQIWARIGGIIAAVSIFVAFIVVFNKDHVWQRALLGIVETLIAYIAGTYLGRMASYGQLGWKLVKDSVEIEVQPLHLDGVAGLKPVGDFYLYQATIVAIPAIFLAIWWFLFPIWPRDYSHWEHPYLGLLSIAIVIEGLAFIVPLLSFHRIMLREKAKWIERADKLCMESNYVKSASESSQLWESISTQNEQAEKLKELFWSIENMATWPVDIKAKKQFKLNNILLFFPLLGDIVKRNYNLVLDDLLKVIKSIG